MAVDDSVPEGQSEKPMPEPTTWQSFKTFFTQGTARWQTLGLVLFIGAIVAVVTSNPAAVNGLRQNLLLKNHAGKNQANEHKIRAALSGVDPEHHDWDDVKAMRHGGQQMQIPGMQQPHFVARRPAPAPRVSEQNRIRNGCAAACAANGYSPTTAGGTATKACVDVCLEEKGVRPMPSAQPVNALSARAMQTLRSRSIPSRGRTGQASPPMAAAQRLLARLQAGASGKQAEAGTTGATSLGAAMKALGVHAHKMSQREGEALRKGVKMDRVIGEREERMGSGLEREWKNAEKSMLTVAAARLANAKNLAHAAAKAEEQNLAQERLDQSVVSAAESYAQTVGSSHDLPVNAVKAQKQLAQAKANDAKLRATARTAEDIYGEEKELWENVRPLTAKQLASAHWVMPGEDTQETQWRQTLDGAAAMAPEEGKEVRLAAMSNGKLLGMEKSAYERNRAATASMSKQLQDLEAARVANAELVHKTMAKAATKKAAEAKLLQAENSFVSAGGKLGPQAILTTSITPQSLAADVQSDREEVQALQGAARGARAMAKQYGEQLEEGVGPLVSAASQSAEARAAKKRAAAAKEDNSLLGGLVRGFKAVTGTASEDKKETKQAVVGGGKGRGEAGVKAVDKASKGWFHLW